MRHDLVLSPVPYPRWNRSARLTLYITHRPEMIKTVSRYLAEKGISIVQSESVRTAYRYEVWSFYVVLPGDRGLREFDRDKKYYVRHCDIDYSKDTDERDDEFKQLRRGLMENCSDALFTDRDLGRELEDAVTVDVNTALHFFYRVAEAGRRRTGADGPPPWVYKPIEFRSEGRGLVTPVHGSPFLAILHAEGHRTEKTPAEEGVLGSAPMQLAPSVAYASLDTRYLHLRVAIIPEHLRRQFFEVSISYRRFGGADNSCGLVAYVTGLLPLHYNIWSSVHRTLESKEESERGQIVMLIEDEGVRYDSHGNAVRPDPDGASPFSHTPLHETQETCVDMARRWIDQLPDAVQLRHGMPRLVQRDGQVFRYDRANATGEEPPAPPAAVGGEGMNDLDGERLPPGGWIVFDKLKSNPSVRGVTKRRVRRKLEQQRAERRTHQVFLSYAQKDDRTAEHVYRRLTSAGLDVYKANRATESGDKFSDEIRSHLLGCLEV